MNRVCVSLPSASAPATCAPSIKQSAESSTGAVTFHSGCAQENNMETLTRRLTPLFLAHVKALTVARRYDSKANLWSFGLIDAVDWQIDGGAKGFL